uniref:ATP synthase subunit a n=1 Tax=Allobates talamancae TaxID=51951 RepID=A0A7M4CGE7_ALLTA|nr:ATP synthase F0 subunit 6 [Allobates talamancae]
MTMDMFDQFSPATLLGISLYFIATCFPWFPLLISPRPFTPNRTSMIWSWFTQKFTKDIFTPISLFGQKWALIFTALMFFILGMNLSGLLPYTFTPTTQLSMNLGLAVPFWLATVVIGFRKQFTTSVGHLLPQGTPSLLTPLLIIIETLSLFIRPLALGVRLTANLTAGHLLIQLTSSSIMALISLPLLSALIYILLVLLTILELAVAVIQAYVFVLLLSLYLAENT